MATRDKQQAVGAPAVVQVGEAPPTRAPTWLVALTVVLGLAVIGLVAWLLVDRLSQPEEVTAAEATQWIDAGEAAMNAGDMEAYGATLATDAVLDDRIAGETVTGRDEIVARQQEYYDAGQFFAHRATDVVMAGDNVAVYGVTYGFTFDDSSDRGVAITIVTFEDEKMTHQVVFEPYEDSNITATD